VVSAGNEPDHRRTVQHLLAGGSTTAHVNQTANGSQWLQIGAALQFNAGTSGYVLLGNATGETGKAVIADAVRFLLVEPVNTLKDAMNHPDGTYVVLQQAKVLRLGAL
jgi:hypothetical protein